MPVSLFPFHLDAFYFLFYSIAMAGTSSTMLNKRDVSRHLHLVPDLRGNAFSFSTFSVVLIVCLLGFPGGAVKINHLPMQKT